MGVFLVVLSLMCDIRFCLRFISEMQLLSLVFLQDHCFSFSFSFSCSCSCVVLFLCVLLLIFYLLGLWSCSSLIMFFTSLLFWLFWLFPFYEVLFCSSPFIFSFFRMFFFVLGSVSFVLGFLLIYVHSSFVLFLVQSCFVFLFFEVLNASVV